MVNQTVVEQLRQAFQTSLPGITAHRKLAPQRLPEQLNRWQYPADCREAAVLIALYPHRAQAHASAEWYLVLIRRPNYPGVHGGQIALPGGQREGQESLQETALREAHEEVGLRPNQVHLLGQLTKLYTPPSNFCIYPFVGFISERPSFEPDLVEVAEIIETPLELLQNPTSFKQERWTFPDEMQREIPFFDVFGHKVWGATAMILSEFLALIDGASD